MADYQYPPFVNVPGEMVSPLPYRFDDALYFNFVIQAERQALQRVLDQWFNIPSQFNVMLEPAMPAVVLTFAFYPKAYSGTTAPPEYGYMQYQEMIFTVLAKPQVSLFGGSNETYSFLSYLFLDRPRPIQAGREMYCLPKVSGSVTMPTLKQEHYDPFSFSVSVKAPNQLDRNAYFNDVNILKVNAPKGWDNGSSMGMGQEKGWNEVNQNLYNSLSRDSGISLDQVRSLTKSLQLKFINYRQWRNFLYPQDAVCKSVFEYYAQDIEIYDVGTMHGEFQLEFPETTEMFPIREALGLYPQIAAAYWYNWSFTFAMGDDIWNSEKGSILNPNLSGFPFNMFGGG